MYCCNLYSLGREPLFKSPSVWQRLNKLKHKYHQLERNIVLWQPEVGAILRGGTIRRIYQGVGPVGGTKGKRIYLINVSLVGSVMYFVVATMANVDPMYQFSLKYFSQVCNVHVLVAVTNLVSLSLSLSLF